MPQKVNGGLLLTEDDFTPHPAAAVVNPDEKWLRLANTLVTNPAVQQLLLAGAGWLVANAQPQKPTLRPQGDKDSQMLFKD